MSETPTTIGPYHAGEIPPPLVLTFKDEAGNALDFSVNGPWSAQFDFEHYGATLVTKTATVSTSTGTTKGQVTYTWVTGDLTTPGDYAAEMWVGNGGTARYRSIRVEWQVLPSLNKPSI